MAELAAGFAAKFGAADLAYWAGLWRDIGKVHPDVRKYLRDHEVNPRKRRRGPGHKGIGTCLSLALSLLLYAVPVVAGNSASGAEPKIAIPPKVLKELKDRAAHPEKYPQPTPPTEQDWKEMRQELYYACPDDPDHYISKETIDRGETTLEMSCLLYDSWLARHNQPEPGEDPDLVRRFLRKGKYAPEKMNDDRYLQAMAEAVKKWPHSKYAHEGLFEAKLRGREFADLPLQERKEIKDHLLKAAKIGAREGHASYYAYKVAGATAATGDKAGLEEFFTQALAEAKPPQRMELYVPYANALEMFKDPKAEVYYRKAVDEAEHEEIEEQHRNLLLMYLLDQERPKEVLAILQPEGREYQLMKRYGVEDGFYRLRCRAQKQLDPHIDTDDCKKAKQSEENLSKIFFPQQTAGEKLLGKLSELLFTEAWAHSSGNEDDCRNNNNGFVPPLDPNQDHPTCETHPMSGPSFCWLNFIYNLAELIQSEANTELFGSRAIVGWTVRNRVLFRGAGVCGNWIPNPNSSLGCAYEPRGPTCARQKDYCRVIHSGAFSVDHHLQSGNPLQQKVILIENLRLAAALFVGRCLEPLAGTPIPDIGGSGIACPSLLNTQTFGTPNVCNKEGLICGNLDTLEQQPNTLRNLDTGAFFGPFYFYSNCIKDYGCFACRGFQKGPGLVEVPSTCSVTAAEACGNSQDYAGSDNCYGRLSGTVLLRQ